MFPIGRIEIAAVIAVGIFALAAALLLGRFTRWSEGTILWASALPIPALSVGLCIYIIVDAVTSSREECGVDACGMAMAAAITMIALASVAFVLSWLIARFGLRIARR